MKELADKKIFDKRVDLSVLNREVGKFAALADLGTINIPSDQEDRAQGASYMKHMQKNEKKRTYDGDTYEIHVHAERDDLNTIVEKAMVEFERMKERRNAAGG